MSGATGKPPEPESNMSKAVIGGVAFGIAAVTAYQTGYLDRFLVKEPKNVDNDQQSLTEKNQESANAEYLKEKFPVPNFQKANVTKPVVESALKNNETISDITEVDIVDKNELQNDLHEKVASGITPESASSSDESITISNLANTKDVPQVEENHHTENPEVKPIKKHEPVEATFLLSQANAVPTENEVKSRPVHHHIPKIRPEVQSSFFKRQLLILFV